MWRKILLAGVMALGGCTTINVTADNGAKVDIKSDRLVTTLPVNAEGNTVPMGVAP